MTTDNYWISVDVLLPEEKEYVLIFGPRTGGMQVARIEKGISREEREKMRRGEIENPLISVSGGNFDTGRKAVYRSNLYYGFDEDGNNKKPYRWYANGRPMDWFGQDVSHWMPLPEEPDHRKKSNMLIRELMELNFGGDS